MKLTTLLLIAAIMQVSANSFAQKITFAEKNARLVDIFNKIRTQSGYDFVVTRDMMKQANPVNINVKNQELPDVLNQIFAGQPLNFTIEEKTVVVSVKELSMIDKITTFFARDSAIYRGRVVNEKGEPLIGATIKLTGAKVGSLAVGPDGHFERYGTKNSVLEISYIGYATQQIKLAGLDPRNQIIVKMVVGENKLNEVTVSTGYQTLPLERATGSFEVVDNKLFNRSTSSDILSRLHDVVPSLYFGDRGTTIRGLSTLSFLLDGNYPSPLIVLDNIPYDGDVNNINPNGVRRDLIRPAKRPCKSHTIRHFSASVVWLYCVVAHL